MDHSTKQSKTVSFSPSAKMVLTIHINDYTDEEIQASWYNSDENKSIKTEIRQSLDQVASNDGNASQYSHSALHRCGNNTDDDDDILCLRGLEGYLPENRKRKMSRRYKSFDAVFMEQDRQWSSGVVDPERIAGKYSAKTLKSLAMASQTGKKDHMECLVIQAAQRVMGTSEMQSCQQANTKCARRDSICTASSNKLVRTR